MCFVLNAKIYPTLHQINFLSSNFNVTSICKEFIEKDEIIQCKKEKTE